MKTNNILGITEHTRATCWIGNPNPKPTLDTLPVPLTSCDTLSFLSAPTPPPINPFSPVFIKTYTSGSIFPSRERTELLLVTK